VPLFVFLYAAPLIVLLSAYICSAHAALLLAVTASVVCYQAVAVGMLATNNAIHTAGCLCYALQGLKNIRTLLLFTVFCKS
jgi:hypothetical protein